MNNSIIRLSSAPSGFGAVVDPVQDGILGNPTQHTHEYFSNDELGLYVGVWDTTDMLEPAEPYSMDEFMLVIEGTATIKDNQRNTSTTISAGQSFAIPKGYDCQWQQAGYLRKFFFISCHPDEDVPSAPAYDGVVLPTTNQASAGSNPFLSDHLDNAEYTDTRGRFQVSSCTTAPFETPALPFARYQLLVVQSGSIDIIDEQQTNHHFTSGDAFFIAKGTICSAKVLQGASLISASLNA